MGFIRDLKEIIRPTRTMPKYDVIRDPIHKYIEIGLDEKGLIDTPPFQRLRYLKQTPTASFVYSGANHTRFEHSLGVMHLTKRISESLQKNIKITEKDETKAIVAALLHDIGHGPFSHTFEVFLKQQGSPELTHQDITQLIIENYPNDELKKIFGFTDADIDDISKLAIGEVSPKLYLAPVIGSQIDADKMDYLLRDSHHTGTVEYGLIDVERLIDNLYLIEHEGIKGVAIKSRAELALEAFFISRYQMYRAVYYHGTARSFDLMVGDVLQASAGDLEFLQNFEEGLTYKKLNEKDVKELEVFLQNYLFLDDYSLITELKKIARRKDAPNEVGVLMDKIIKRDHYRDVYTKIFPSTSTFATSALSNSEFLTKKEEEIMEVASVSNMVKIDVPHPITDLTIDHEKIKIMDEYGKIKTLGSFIPESSMELLKLMHDEKIIEFVVMTVYTDTQDRKIRRKIKEAAKDVILGGHGERRQNV